MRLAIQLFTLRTIDAVAAFPTLAAQGYEAVELFERPDDADELRRRLDDAGLEACGWHVGLERLEGELDEVVDQARVLGVAAPRRPVGGAAGRPRRRGGAGASGSPALRERVAAAGLPARVPQPRARARAARGRHRRARRARRRSTGLELELDLGWAWVAGADPVTLLATHAGRVPLVHAKDFGDGETSVPVGDGARRLRADRSRRARRRCRVARRRAGGASRATRSRRRRAQPSSLRRLL